MAGTGAGLANLWQNPWFQAGIGMLSANQGVTGDAAFRNALGGGLGGMLRGQTMVQDIQRQQAQTEALRQQQEMRARQMEQQRRLAAAAPQLAAGMLSNDPDLQRQAATGLLGMAPELLPQMAVGMLGQEQPQPTARMRFIDEFLAMPQEQQRAAKEAGLVGAPDTVVNLGPKLPAGYYAPTGDVAEGVAPIPGGPATKPTQAQEAASGYVNRMIGAEQVMTDLFGQYSTAGIAALQSPMIGGAARFAVSPETQRVKAAQDDWIRAKLRKESGAVIGKQEMADERAVYFEQPGDKPETIATKRRLRQTAIEGMATQAGPLFKGETPKLDIPVIRSDKDLEGLPKGTIVYVPERGEFMRTR